MASDRLYSQFVGWLKVLLPLAALAILSSVFYFARGTEDTRRIPFVTVRDSDLERERIDKPEYMAVTGDGATVRIVAREVVPVEGKVNVFTADAITGQIETPEGRMIQATAPRGTLDIDGQLADMTGIVSIDTSDGFHVLADQLHARLDVTFVRSGGPVRGEAPFGRVEAGEMRYEGVDGEAGLLRFTGGVKVIYQPRN